LLEFADQLRRGLRNRAGRRDDDAQSFIADPLGVVALLGHRPGVQESQHRQPEVNGFAQAARTGLADEKIAQPHRLADLRGEADHCMRR